MFRNQGAADVFAGIESKAARKACPPAPHASVRRELVILIGAGELADLRVPPGNQLEASKATARVSTLSASTVSFVFALFGLSRGTNLEALIAPTQTEFARRIGVTFARLNKIVNGKRGVSTDAALRFAKALGATSDLWLNIQRMSDMYEALHSPKAKEIAKIKPVEREAARASRARSGFTSSRGRKTAP